ncbi:hypothetical protein EO98_17690 [Methanosarcina sp. 2.H.T.1A.6]|uniref:hypothetical protein n=1 Tax=unclassified Methanosarcina TaxID=2644672 RepID=UPI000621D3ED|nr:MULTISPECIES: hypothetical protein [unclassified Methanosarcina]KKG24580.1 hypothetical protein EO98_17690 [Methanosarcina sp. 2.H.T.1A.6]KKG25819.1 hypothetical protein EO96_19530 [Methanosarcina sp. 2.H.T.1A.8]KKG26617.1 hypothetical protein EO97_15695 [Methanosarcina sp. 2.H.T.1A.15]
MKKVSLFKGMPEAELELIPKLKNHLFELDFEIIIGAADQKIGSDTYEFRNKSWFWDRLLI